jgi:hypothetical protein
MPVSQSASDGVRLSSQVFAVTARALIETRVCAQAVTDERGNRFVIGSPELRAERLANDPRRAPGTWSPLPRNKMRVGGEPTATNPHDLKQQRSPGARVT